MILIPFFGIEKDRGIASKGHNIIPEFDLTAH
jgi:hypothetical protein